MKHLPDERALLAALRRQTRKELLSTQAAWKRHERKYGKCEPGCMDRRAFQERVATLTWTLKLLGARQNRIFAADTTTIDDYRGMDT